MNTIMAAARPRNSSDGHGATAMLCRCLLPLLLLSSLRAPTTGTAAEMFVKNGSTCIADERDALLSFKAGITSDPSRWLRSWRQGQDCCGDSPEVKNALLQQGYTHLLIQMGRGTYVPSKVSEDATLQVDHFTFSPSIADHMRTASLVISHAGSGSIFETLRLGKPLIVVVNEDLMDNHQSELAEELAERKHLFCARPQTLGETIQAMDLGTLVPYVPGDAKPVVTLINKFVGFPVD
ncbi:hypothetical protein U9M48_041568 [Paspalum notatum var. saurae]|uniref:Glycosyl transferase family 28 C-terminal domain-containing protein n=1 Tax=Paspalum notatum var. saurae TaxID=547442 RepID=A0AAQ3USX6_PASNO